VIDSRKGRENRRPAASNVAVQECKVPGPVELNLPMKRKKTMILTETEIGNAPGAPSALSRRL
jgi:hypothetical protein